MDSDSSAWASSLSGLVLKGEAGRDNKVSLEAGFVLAGVEICSRGILVLDFLGMVFPRIRILTFVLVQLPEGFALFLLPVRCRTMVEFGDSWVTHVGIGARGLWARSGKGGMK